MKALLYSFQIREKASLRVPVEPNFDLSRLIHCGVTVTYLPSLEVASLSVNNPVSNVSPHMIHVKWRNQPGNQFNRDQGGPSTRPQQQGPSLYDCTTKLEETVEAMTSKIILMMPKNQELRKFQRIRSQKALRIKFQRIKIQE